MENAVKYKSLYLFIIGACSLLTCGFLFNKQSVFNPFVLLIWCTISGIYIIYRFNDFIDQSKNFAFNLKRFFSSNKNTLITLQFLLFAAPLSIYTLSSFQVLILSVSCGAGLIYSLSFNHNHKNYRIKNIFLLKNIFIGFSWGALVLIGANNCSANTTVVVFLLASLQVLIGSIIRDIPDVEKDYHDNVKTLPIVFGIKKTIFILMLLNLSQLSLIYLTLDAQITLLIFFVLLWRTLFLIVLLANYHSKLWTQTFNVLTCFIIFLIVLIQRML